LINNNVKRITLSPELTLDKLKYLKDRVNSLSICEVIVYGRLEVMVMKYCPLNMLINKSKYPCNICRSGNNYYLEDLCQ
jgi:collagenase-like PrtC family protease